MDILARINREDGITEVVSLHQVDVGRPSLEWPASAAANSGALRCPPLA